MNFKKRIKETMEKVKESLKVGEALFVILIASLFFKPELIPEIVKGVIGGMTTGIVTLAFLLEFGAPNEIAIIGALITLSTIFLSYYLPNRKKGEEAENNPLLFDLHNRG